MKINNQKSGDKSTNVQAGRDVVVNKSTIALYSIEEVAKQLMGSVFGELPKETIKQIEANQKSYFQALSENLIKITKQNEELKKVIDSADFQYISKAATISASRSSSNDLHRSLASLITQRINHDADDLKMIVYNEAISTIVKLTKDQLRIITLCFILRYTSHSSIVSWENYNHYLNTKVKPFLNFKNTDAEFQHIEYAGCGSIGIGGWDLIGIHRQEYSFLFLNLIEKKIIDDLELPTEIKKEIIALNIKEDKYFIRLKNKQDLQKYVKDRNIQEETVNRLIAVYESNIKNDDLVKAKIVEETSLGKKLIEVLEKTSIRNLSLTSVGIAIAASYLEQVTGEKINISIWIN